MLLEHVKARGLEGMVGFELGNELFAPLHLSHAQAAEDIGTIAKLFKEVWNASAESPPPRLYATGTNDCQSNNNSDILAALDIDGIDAGFSFHSYPADQSK
jgi:hypothetical protein